MKIKSFLLYFMITASSFAASNIIPAEIIYSNPAPGAKSVPVQSGIIIRFDEKYQPSLNEGSLKFDVTGEKSGIHNGKVIISGSTAIFEPDNYFEISEKVDVSVNSSLFAAGKKFSFSFETNTIREFDPEIFRFASEEKNFQSTNLPAAPSVVGKPTTINGVTVPSDFPSFNIVTSNVTAPGRIFISNWGGTSYMMIMENNGTPYFYKRFPGSNQTRDFKIQPTGTLTRRVYENLNCFVEMDSQFVNIDTFRCKNGYGTDEHEIQMTQNGHSFLIALDYRTVNMSQIVPGGQVNATVIGNHVQELDENHNVVFEFNTWNNFHIADAVHENLTANTIDYIHMNSIAIDYDSNIVISSRHLSEVTKINRRTGQIMWRLGGAHNQFSFPNDTYRISYQHDARPVPGMPNHYTVFDNGNFHSPSFSRVVEYRVDTVNMTATKVWEYRRSPDYYTGWMGNAQRLPNGNTFIDWADNGLPKAYEVTSLKEKVYEANFVQSMPCYRAYRFEWESVSKAPYLVAESYTDKVTLIFNKFGDKRVEKYIVYGGLTPNPATKLDSTANTFINLTNLTNNQRYYFRVTARDSNGTESVYSNEENVLVRMTQPGQNMIQNGDFANGSTGWIFNARNGAAAQGAVVNGQYVVTITNSGSAYSDIQLIQESFPMINGKNYIFSFDARANSNRILEPRVAQNGGNYTVYSKTGPMLITPIMKTYEYQFQMTDPTDYNARLVMNFGTSAITCFLDNIVVKENIPSGSGNENSGIPGEFILYPNFPNPFNPSTVIKYSLPEPGAVKIEVFDIMGESVVKPVTLQQGAGSNEYLFDGAGLSSGIYYCRIGYRSAENNEFKTSVNKMVLLK